MKMKITSISVVLVLVISMMTAVDISFDVVPKVSGTTIYVDDSGGANYTTIQEAVDAAIDGDMVFVYNGTYYENVIVNKRIHLMGESKDNTIIDGGGNDNTLTITTDYVNITQLKIINGKFGGIPEDCAGLMVNSNGNTISGNNISANQEHALYLSSSNGNFIDSNIMTWNSRNGLYMVNSNWNKIERNTIDTNGDGAYLESSGNNSILGNIIVNHGGYGITLQYSHDNTISNTNLTGNQAHITLGSAHRNLITNNTMAKGSGMSYPIYGINLASSNENNISGNNFSKGEYGIYGNILENNMIYDNQMFYYTAGLDFRQGVRNTISSCHFSNNMFGMILQSSSEWNNITQNTFLNNHDYGIIIGTSSHNFITGNSMEMNGQIGGINLEDSTYITLKDNSMLFDSVFLTGDLVEYWNTHDIDTTNLVDGKPVRYQKDLTGGVVPINSGQVILANCTNVIVTDQEISNGSVGILLGLSTDNTVKQNTISEFRDVGIYLFKSDNNLISENSATEPLHSDSSYSDGFHLERSNENEITKNTVSDHMFGFCLDKSDRNNITLNKAFLNTYGGIILGTSKDNIIKKNICESSYHEGIKLWRSTGNIMVKNQITHNSNGIHLSLSNNNTMNNNTIMYNNAGISTSSSSNNSIFYNLFYKNSFGVSAGNDATSKNNSIFHNAFLQNSNQARDKGYNTHWNKSYPIGGNFWSDYGGSDLFSGPNQDIPGSDGIGDTPYDIEPASQDNYPLMSSPVNFMFLENRMNLMSVPISQEGDDLEELLFPIFGGFESVQLYDPTDTLDPWKHYHKLKPANMNDLSIVDNSMALWVDITDPDGMPFRFIGNQPIQNQTISLYSGWNMIGYPSLTNHNRTMGLNNLAFGTEIDAIQWFDSSTKTWQFLEDGDSFEVGRGYWFHAKTDCVWEVPL